MATANFTIKYRPVRIGFLVKEGSVEDLIKVAGINTLLWGGIYNPIIPVSKDKRFAEQLLNLFSVDTLFPTSHTKEIDEIIKANRFLRDPGHYAQNIFYEDWGTKKNIIAYLDSLNIVDYYWNHEFRHKPKDYESNFALVKWEDDDGFKNLFSILFGCFPTTHNLREDFKVAFLKGLRSKEIKISPNDSVTKNLGESIYPLKSTGLELDGYGGTWGVDGIYIGDGNDFDDLLYFWNLRAAGLVLGFLPKNDAERFEEFIRAFLQRLDNIPNRNPNIEDCINVYHRDPYERTKQLLKDFQVKKRFVFSHCDKVIWNGLNIKPANFYFRWDDTLAITGKSYDRYTVSASLPEKKFIIDDGRNVGSQYLAVSIDANGEFEYPRHTLNPPFIRQLNEFYSREIAFNPWKIRVGRDGITEIIRVHDNSLYLYPLSHQVLIEKIFELAGMKVKISPAGLLASQIIYGMREESPLEACRVFKIRGVRRLIKSLKSNESIGWDQALEIIGEEKFTKFKKLHIESRTDAELKPQHALNFLLKKKVLVPHLRAWERFLRKRKNYRCKRCGLESEILLTDFEGLWHCQFCDYEQYLPSFIGPEFRKQYYIWSFKKGRLFARNNDQLGAIPVILTLLVFKRILDASNFVYSLSLDIETESKSCEVDFCVLRYQQDDKIQLGIGECKDEWGRVNRADIDNLMGAKERIESIGIECYLIFSKTANEFNPDEIDLFKALKSENTPFILFTNRELEPYHPYWETGREDLPFEYVHTLGEISRNSQYIYLE